MRRTKSDNDNTEKQSSAAETEAAGERGGLRATTTAQKSKAEPRKEEGEGRGVSEGREGGGDNASTEKQSRDAE